MAIEIPVHKPGCLVAAADLSTHQFKVVVISAAMTVNLAAVAGKVYGLLQNKPIAGEAAEVTRLGVAKGMAGAAIAAGATVSSDANGKLRTAVTGDYPLGQALEAASADLQIISIELAPSLVPLA